jgi:hypothetical protein
MSFHPTPPPFLVVSCLVVWCGVASSRPVLSCLVLPCLVTIWRSHKSRLYNLPCWGSCWLFHHGFFMKNRKFRKPRLRVCFVMFLFFCFLSLHVLCFALNSLLELGLGLGLGLGVRVRVKVKVKVRVQTVCLSMTALSHFVALPSPKPNRDRDRTLNPNHPTLALYLKCPPNPPPPPLPSPPPPLVWHHIPSVQALPVKETL